METQVPTVASNPTGARPTTSPRTPQRPPVLLNRGSSDTHLVASLRKQPFGTRLVKPTVGLQWIQVRERQRQRQSQGPTDRQKKR